MSSLLNTCFKLYCKIIPSYRSTVTPDFERRISESDTYNSPRVDTNVVYGNCKTDVRNALSIYMVPFKKISILTYHLTVFIHSRTIYLCQVSTK